ncbi:hypothetical protein C9374_008489 [Naegleria lovaniensis]|uniref:RNA helicase n=1 Tax=Naegleria lovaniensis TaxID=51637 RepID=A0AA88GJJ0_NAELO|nr:uncharacterized protein C9374_008489 [Naegleria lovaniensis]KAG2378346.1 hypothetical protein C9374_008489 [Naegleria lovaniensis]
MLKGHHHLRASSSSIQKLLLLGRGVSPLHSSGNCGVAHVWCLENLKNNSSTMIQHQKGDLHHDQVRNYTSSGLSCLDLVMRKKNGFGYHPWPEHLVINSSTSCKLVSSFGNVYSEQNGVYGSVNYCTSSYRFNSVLNKDKEQSILELLDEAASKDMQEFIKQHSLDRNSLEQRVDYDYLLTVIEELTQNQEKRELARSMGVEDDNDWKSSVSSFQFNFLHHFDTDSKYRHKVKKAFKAAQKENKVQELIWNLYLRDLEQQIEEEKNLQMADLTEPHHLYPLTRLKPRKIIFHIGPTNSGKTYNAFQALRNAKTGIYCAPLRLLATEAFVKLTSGDNPIAACQLITGDFKIETENATHTCSTTEMVDTQREVDVAVIDEIQLITDSDRGWSWTRALLGVRAKEVHLCGEGRVLKLVKKLCEDTGDELEVKEYDRLTPLKVTKKPTVKDYGDLQRGDCIVCFSRKEVFKIKNEIEKSTDLRVCVVYGGLPPQTRITQAALFNHEQSPYDVLVATDAIGMGLNLNIRRIIFSETEKFDGKEVRTLTPHEIKQIGGRAGRFNSAFEEGEVTSFRASDCRVIQQAFAYDPSNEVEELRAGLFPTDEQIDHFSRISLETGVRVRLSTILSKIDEMAKLNEGKYFMCDMKEKKDIANIIHPIENLTTAERMIFVKSPIDPDEQLCKTMTFKWAKLYSEGKYVPLLIPNPNSLRPINTLHKLKELEVMYKCLNIYCWLSYRLMPFNEREKALEYQEIIRKLIEDSLKKTVSLERAEKQVHQRSKEHHQRSFNGYKKTSVKRKSISKKHRMQVNKMLAQYDL